MSVTNFQLKITTFALAILSSFYANAGCGQGTPAKYQMLVVWNGVNDFAGDARGAFDEPVITASEKYGSKGHKQWLALGGSVTNYDGKKGFIPAAKAGPEFTQNAKVVEASPEGLQKISKEINAEYEDLRRRDKNLRPEDVQVIFMVTNHGTMTTGKNGKTFGIAASPLAKTKTVSNGGAPQITQEEVTQFASALPEGIRTKAVFGQCYGANLMESYLKGLKSNNRCACGAAASDLNVESYDPAWDSDVLLEARGKSLAIGVNKRRFLDEMNISSTSSENFLYGYFLRKADELGIKTETGDDILKNSHMILEKMQNQKTTLSKEDQDILEETVRIHESSYYDWIRKENVAKTKDLLSYSGRQALRGEKSEKFDKKYASSKDPLLDRIQEINASYSIVPRLEQDHSREEILKAFLLSASTEEKNAFKDLTKCEQDPLEGQSAATTDKKSNSDATGDANKSEKGVN
jgi:hypothetical protein